MCCVPPAITTSCPRTESTAAQFSVVNVAISDYWPISHASHPRLTNRLMPCTGFIQMKRNLCLGLLTSPDSLRLHGNAFVQFKHSYVFSLRFCSANVAFSIRVRSLHRLSPARESHTGLNEVGKFSSLGLACFHRCSGEWHRTYSRIQVNS